MFIYDLIDKVNKAKLEKERKAAQQTYASVIGTAAIISAGAIIGFLFTTKSGKEVREKIMKRAYYTVEDIKEKFIHKAERFKDSFDAAADRLTEAAGDVRDKAEGVKEELKAGGVEIKNDIRDTAENISKELKT